MEGKVIKGLVPDSKLHLEEQVILCQIVRQDKFPDHLKWVVTIFINTRLPHAQSQFRLRITR